MPPDQCALGGKPRTRPQGLPHFKSRQAPNQRNRRDDSLMTHCKPSEGWDLSVSGGWIPWLHLQPPSVRGLDTPVTLGSVLYVVRSPLSDVNSSFFFFFFLGVGASYSTRSNRQGYKRKPPDKVQRTKDRGLRTKRQGRQENKRETKRPKTRLGKRAPTNAPNCEANHKA